MHSDNIHVIKLHHCMFVPLRVICCVQTRIFHILCHSKNDFPSKHALAESAMIANVISVTVEKVVEIV